ncbi:MAG: hypothetical protein AB1714_24560 [Acidobacteriota bacterium]
MRLSSGLAVALMLLAGGSAKALTVDELIARNVEARGGIDKIRAITSIRATGKVRMGSRGSALVLNTTRLMKRPGMVRTEVIWQGLTAVTAYDGGVGWQISPYGGRMDPEQMSADDAKGLKRMADMDGPLVDYKSKGNLVEHLGTEDVDGTEAHKIKVTFKDGDIRYIYLDPDYFLEIREIDQTRRRGVEEIVETDLGDYELVSGVYMPFSIEIGAKGQPKGYKLMIEKVETKVDLDDALFHFPAAPAGGEKQR